MSLNAGRLRHNVSIESWEKVRDSSGQVIQNPVTGEISYAWIEIDKVWAAIEPSSAREFIAAQAVQSKVTARIIIRQRSDLLPSMRINHNGKLYSIEGIMADKDSGLEYQTLLVSEGIER